MTTKPQHEANSPAASGRVAIVFTSDWGVSTGVGHAGRTHSQIERGSDGEPVVRGTVIAGVLREQAFVAARALDTAKEARTGRWTEFARWLFGQDPDSPADSRPRSRHVVFTDATPLACIPVHDTVSLAINRDTGTARDQMLRFTERAAPGVLAGTFLLIDQAGAEITDPPTVDAARFLLGIAGLMVQGIGSGRSGGDGACTVLVSGETLGAPAERSTSVLSGYASKRSGELRGRLRESAKSLTAGVIDSLPRPGSHRGPEVGSIVGAKAARGGGDHLVLDITLKAPIVSYEVPFSNEVRSLDFLRGTALLPWLHRTLSASAGTGSNQKVLANAVTAGHLLVSDALPVVGGVEGLPVPLTIKRDKTSAPDAQLLRLYGSLSGECDESSTDSPQIPVRGGYVFLSSPAGRDCDTDSDEAHSSGWYGRPPMRGRQTSAINHETGAASTGQLVLVEALPGGMHMRAHVWISEALWHADQLRRLLGKEQEARLGSRKLTGTFGLARCMLREENPREKDARERFGNAAAMLCSANAGTRAETTIWFTSDVIARSASMGPGGTLEDLLSAFTREGITLSKAGAPSIRHRRVDSWSPADNGPRATRLAIQAGSVVRVQLSDENRRKLVELAPRGVGELTAQGYGRFVVDHPLLDMKRIDVIKTRRKHFVPTKDQQGGDAK